MKKYLLALATVSLFAACQQKENENGLSSGKATITGTIAGAQDGYLLLMRAIKEDAEPDSVKLEKGKFSHTVQLEEPELMMLQYTAATNPRNAQLLFYADPGTVTIKASADSLFKAEVSGGKTQAFYKKANEKANAIYDKGKPLFEAFQQAQLKNDMAQAQMLEMQIVQLQEEAKKAILTEAKANPGNVASALFAMQYLGQGESPADVTELGKFYDTLSPAVKQSFFGKKIGDIVKASKSTEIGNMAPDFTLNNPDGKPVSLSSLRGQYVLVDFWASWCGPCRQENPNVVKAYQAYKSKGFTILGVSLDKDRDPWLEAIKKDKLTWEQVSDLKFWQSPVVELYGIRGIPANVLLDKEGKIIAKNLRGADLEAKLAEVLN